MTATTTPDAAQASAQAILNDVLSQYGLQGLGAQLWQQYLNGVPFEQVLLNMRQTPEYKTRFPAMATLAAKGHAITEADYINLEKSYVQILRAGGLPAGFYDTPQALSDFIANEVSPSEMQGRVLIASQAVTTAPPEVRQQLHSLYGLSQGDLAAYFLDDTTALPVLQQRLQAATAAGAGQRAGYGQLSRQQAEYLATLGLSDTALSQGFGQLGLQGQLFHALPGEATPDVSVDTQLAAAFGQNAPAQREIENIAKQRVGQFAAGTQYEQAQQGVVGVGQYYR